MPTPRPLRFVALTLISLTLGGCVSSGFQTSPETVQESAFSPYEQRTDAEGILLNNAWYAMKSQQYDSADAALGRAMRINPTNPEIYFLLAQLRNSEGNPRLAEDLAIRALSLAPEDSLRRQISTFVSSLKTQEE